MSRVFIVLSRRNFGTAVVEACFNDLHKASTFIEVTCQNGNYKRVDEYFWIDKDAGHRYEIQLWEVR